MKKALVIFFLGVCFMMYPVLTVQAGGMGITSVGAKASAMGGSFRAIANDWSAAYYNPAGLFYVTDNELTVNEVISNFQLKYTPNIAADNPSAANTLANKIEKNLELLSDNPKLGRIPRDEEIRNLGYRYIIIQNNIVFYTIDERTIFIHRILHSARNYKSLL